MTRQWSIMFYADQEVIGCRNLKLFITLRSDWSEEEEKAFWLVSA